jgi:dihydrofolate reductase
MARVGWDEIAEGCRVLRRRADEAVEFVKGDVAGFGNRLRKVAGKDVWLVGGGALIGDFLDARQIDEYIIHIVPVLIGEGIPLLNG